MKGNVIILLILAVVFVVGVGFTIINFGNPQPPIGVDQPPQIDPMTNPKVYIAKRLADEINKYPDIKLQDAENAIEAVKSYNEIIVPAAKNDFGINLPEVDKKKIELAEKYTPVLGPYSDLRQSARNLDINRMETVDDFYVNFGIFSFSVAFIQYGGASKASGEISKTAFKVMKDTGLKKKLMELCGVQCVSKFRKDTRDFLESKLNLAVISLEQWIAEFESYDWEGIRQEVQKGVNNTFDITKEETNKVIDISKEIFENVSDVVSNIDISKVKDTLGNIFPSSQT